MDIVDASREYERWLAGFGPLNLDDLAYKHARMADPGTPFPFFRGTYYHWVRHWLSNGGELLDAPRVLAIGDLHIENYGTWRDSDGRLCWGVNDFDEAAEMPYTTDLVRLAASIRLARKSMHLSIKFGAACRAIMTGYCKSLQAGGMPFVLEEHHPHLRAVAMAAERAPVRFWPKLTRLLNDPPVDLPDTAMAALNKRLPVDGLICAYRNRPRVGMGSLGKSRFVALAEWSGGMICREAKRIVPPASSWVDGAGEAAHSRMAEAAEHAVRAPDPFYHPDQEWVVRRLAPHCSRIELDHLVGSELERILEAMGAETTNIHLGTGGMARAISADLQSRPDNWLKKAARIMADLIKLDWKQWRSDKKH
jgi:hypothetical protein